MVRGDGGNTHLLVADGPVSWAPSKTRDAVQGTLVVEDQGSAYLVHPEHGLTAVGPGQYVVRRQVEQADELRIVAD